MIAFAAHDTSFPGKDPPVQGQARRILVADEDEDSRRQSADILRRHGYVVFEVSTAAALLQAVRERLVEAAVVDAGLADKTGGDLFGAADGPVAAVAVVLCTASYNVDRAVEAMKRGACDYFTRPSGPGRLLAGVAHAVQTFDDRVARARRWQSLQRVELFARLAGEVLAEHPDGLTTIMGHAELVNGTLDEGDPRRHEIAEIRRCAENFTELHGQVLPFRNPRSAPARDLDLTLIVMRLTPMFKRLMGNFVKITSDLSTGLGLIRANEAEIEQLVANLVLNAWDAMPQGGRLYLHTANDEFAELTGTVPAGSYVVLSVRDTGVGMDAQTRGHLFQPFFTTRPPGLGSGLGLAVVADIVTRAGGYITVSSDIDQGTAVTIFFPRLPAASTIVEAPKTEGPCGEVQP
jgi:two-component system, cell cycle sensor histidine kinase and response regulator CckA